jgi:hypothetical protein
MFTDSQEKCPASIFTVEQEDGEALSSETSVNIFTSRHGTWADLNGYFVNIPIGLCVCMRISLSLLGNGWVKTLPRQRIHTQEWKNCRMHRFLSDSCRIKENSRLVLHRTSYFISRTIVTVGTCRELASKDHRGRRLVFFIDVTLSLWLVTDANSVLGFYTMPLWTTFPTFR